MPPREVRRKGNRDAGIKQPVPPEDIPSTSGLPERRSSSCRAGGSSRSSTRSATTSRRGSICSSSCPPERRSCTAASKRTHPIPTLTWWRFPSSPAAEPGALTELQASIDGIGQQWGYLQAALHAIERFQGAELASDVEAQINQLEALDTMSTGAADAMEDTVAALRAWSDVASTTPSCRSRC